MDALDALIGDWIGAQDAKTVETTLEAAGVPVSRVYTLPDIFQDAHYQARDMIETHALPDGNPVSLPGIVPRLSETPGQTRWVGPELGAHTEEVLASIGIAGQDFEALRKSGVV